MSTARECAPAHPAPDRPDGPEGETRNPRGTDRITAMLLPRLMSRRAAGVLAAVAACPSRRRAAIGGCAADRAGHRDRHRQRRPDHRRRARARRRRVRRPARPGAARPARRRGARPCDQHAARRRRGRSLRHGQGAAGGDPPGTRPRAHALQRVPAKQVHRCRHARPRSSARFDEELAKFVPARRKSRPDTFS